MPGLDGLRAIAVLAVIAFHEQLGWAQGGLLGVGLFFTLSGYLITDLLLGHWARKGRLGLADFWARRARRLLPALFVMLAVVSAWITLADRARLAGLRGAVVAAATYSSNWYLIYEKQSYFARFAPAAPMDHLWSLAVEEQFYLIWPWLLLGGLVLLRFARRGRPGGVAWLAVPTLLLAAASTIAMFVLYHPGFDPTRVYEGSDTRAGGLLIGAALAMAWPSRRGAGGTSQSPAGTGSAEPGSATRQVPGRMGRAALDGGAFAGLVVIALMIWRTGQYSPFLYRGGLVLLSAAAAAVIAAVAVPGSVTGLVLGWRPLRWLGVRSYGIYLWHYPVIVLTTPANTGENLVRAAWQTALTIVIAALSWRFIEEPIRQGALGRLWARARSFRQLSRRPRTAYLATAGGSLAVLAIACAGLASPVSATSGTADTSVAAGSALPSNPGTSGHGASAAGAAGGDTARAPGGSTGTGSTGSPASSAAATLPTGVQGKPSPDLSPHPAPSALPVPRTSCRAVAHIGDSTSEGMVSADYLPNPAQRLAAQYNDVGVQQVTTNIVGANSVVETLPGDVNGYDTAKNIVSGGFRGCWVIALGTNDTADVAIGSSVGMMARVQQMMSVANGEPVMWVNTVSLLNSGPYAEANMEKWDATLVQACAQYKNMRVLNWSAIAQPNPGWFISDGIHYTSAGYAIRAQQIAYGLAEAFPAKGRSHGCLVN
jgi:peptidoglycan/LPS O-acetylase OafA/YrhL